MCVYLHIRNILYKTKQECNGTIDQRAKRAMKMLSKEIEFGFLLASESQMKRGD